MEKLIFTLPTKEMIDIGQSVAEIANSYENYFDLGGFFSSFDEEEENIKYERELEGEYNERQFT